MKNLTTLFLAFFLVSSTVSTLFAQGTANDARIWSIVQPDPNGTVKNNFQSTWVPAEPLTRYFGVADATVGPNYRVLPGNTTQSELSIDVHPTNSNIVFGSSNATNWPVTTLYGTGVYWTLDGGASWTGFDNPPFGSNSGDPVSVIGQDGRFYENYINNAYGLSASVSTNSGVTWTTQVVTPNPGSLADKNHFMVDKTASSPYVNRSYCAWTEFGGSLDGEVALRYSTNFGSTWSAKINVSGTLTPLGSAFGQGANVQTGPNGELYVTYAIYDAQWTDGEDGIGFSKSTDGGTTWTHVRAYNQVNFGIRGNLSSKNAIRVSSFPSMAVDRSGGPHNGNIYITWPQEDVAPAGTDPDIVLVKSTDNGVTWTAPIRVNDDALNNGKDQYYPWCTVDQSTGQLMLIFYDSRDVPNSQAEVFMATSLDGGNTFANFKVSDQPHTPTPISGLAGGYAGDYIGIAALDDIAYPFWADNRLGSDHYQAWTASVTFGPPCPVDPPSNPNPPSGATGVAVTGNTATWTNGAGATQVEVWFGEVGSLTQVYNGSLITSFSLAPVEPLSYNTTYGWQIRGKNDTCTVPGPVWTFTTIQDPNLVTAFTEPFNDLNCWTAIGPLGLTNWSLSTSTNAGGSPPTELELYWSPSFVGLSQILSCPINSSNLYVNTVSWKQYLSFFASPGPAIGLAVTYDGGTTSTSLWEITTTGNIPPEEKVITFTPTSSTYQLIFYLNGDIYNINWWDLDDIMVQYSVPVELTSFAANVINNEVELNWSTATETNNQGFDVERMNASGAFEKIGYVAGFGTTTEPKSYSFIDSKLESGNYTYRLKQVDFDGSFTYSDEVNVDVEIPLEYALEQNYPNPFNPSTTIKYSIPEDGFVKLAVYNMLGEEVATVINSVQKAGRYEVNLNASNLASGVYVYRIEAANFTASKKLMLMK
jgi:hypothetical protein